MKDGPPSGPLTWHGTTARTSRTDSEGFPPVDFLGFPCGPAGRLALGALSVSGENQHPAINERVGKIRLHASRLKYAVLDYLAVVIVAEALQNYAWGA